MAPAPARKGFEVKPGALYLVDNDACYCGDHLGYSARTTGRDISGRKIAMVPAYAVKANRMRCEKCPR